MLKFSYQKIDSSQTLKHIAFERNEAILKNKYLHSPISIEVLMQERLPTTLNVAPYFILLHAKLIHERFLIRLHHIVGDNFTFLYITL